MQYDEENRECRPLGVNEAESIWLDQMSKYRSAANNDIYTNGGLLDNVSKYGFNTPHVYNNFPFAKDVLEREFTYEELSFISRCRLTNITIPEIDRLISLIKKYKEKLIAAQASQAQQQMMTQPGFLYNSYPVPTPRYTVNNDWASNAWFKNGPSSLNETDNRPKRGRKAKKTEEVETEEATATETKTETTNERNDQIDALLTESSKSLFAKINNDSI